MIARFFFAIKKIKIMIFLRIMIALEFLFIPLPQGPFGNRSWRL